MISGTDPRSLLHRLIPECTDIPDDLSNIALWKIILQIVAEPPRRKKLPEINTLADVVRLIKESKKIMVLTGAGVSVPHRLMV
jgi:NAD-dependent deacetylase sirtuin 1